MVGHIARTSAVISGLDETGSNHTRSLSVANKRQLRDYA